MSSYAIAPRLSVLPAEPLAEPDAEVAQAFLAAVQYLDTAILADLGSKRKKREFLCYLRNRVNACLDSIDAS